MGSRRGSRCGQRSCERGRGGARLVENVRRARLDLRVEDSEPERLRGHLLARAALALVLCVESLELLPPHVAQPRRLVGAEEGPVAVGLHKRGSGEGEGGRHK
eukprot:6195620-Pleurochrysis_carterae.AAC.7